MTEKNLGYIRRKYQNYEISDLIDRVSTGFRTYPIITKHDIEKVLYKDFQESKFMVVVDYDKMRMIILYDHKYKINSPFLIVTKHVRDKHMKSFKLDSMNQGDADAWIDYFDLQKYFINR